MTQKESQSTSQIRLSSSAPNCLGVSLMRLETKAKLVEDGLERIDDAAKFLAISPGKLRAMIRQRTISVVRVGRAVRVSRKALIAFAAAKLD